MTPRVLFVSHSREVGGAELYLLNVLRHLSAARPWELRLVCRTDAAVDRLAADAANFCDVARLDAVRPRDLLRLRRLAVESDAIHLNLAFPSGKYQLAAALTADLARRPLIVTHHLALPVPPQWWLFMRRLGRAARRHIAISEQQRGFLIERFRYPSERVITVRNGIDASLFQPAAAAPADHLCVTVARLSPQKGLPDLLAALTLVGEKVPQVRLTVIGEGPLRDEVLQRGRALGDDFTLEGALTRHEVAARLAGADVYVLPSRYEGGPPLALMEAMSCGLPCVATDVTGVRELISGPELGRVVPVGDVRAIAAAVVELLADRSLRAAIGGRARMAVLEHFTLERSMRETEAVFAQVVHG